MVKLLYVAIGLAAVPCHAACVSPFTMLESAEMRAERAGGTAVMIQGSMAFLLAYAINNTGTPTSYYGDQLVIWPEDGNTNVAFVLGGCGTGELAILGPKAFAAVAKLAYPRHDKHDWRPL